MTLHTWKAAQARQQLGQLRRELERWDDALEERDHLEPLFQRSDKVLVVLRAFLTRVEAALNGAADLAAINGVELQLVGIRKVWHYFLDKFRQRDIPELRLALKLADELAWACYKPWIEAATPAVDKLRPLVHFSTEDSPFAVAREQIFTPPTMSQKELDNDSLSRLTERLPVSVIGVPWFQVEDPSQAAVIAHEVGHLVEKDFGLEGALQQALDAAIPDDTRRRYWRIWRSESFADFHGALTMGAAYAIALTSYLTAAPATIAAEQASRSSLYPPRHVRLTLVSAVLALKGLELAPPATTLWHEAYKPAASLAPFAEDAVRVARAWAELKPPAFSEALGAIPHGPLTDQDKAADCAERYLDKLSLHTADDLRHLFAGATLASARDPAGWAAENARGGRGYLSLIDGARPPFALGPGDDGPELDDTHLEASASDLFDKFLSF